jgi:hypothetical protein
LFLNLFFKIIITKIISKRIPLNLRNLLQLCSLIYSTKIQNIWRWVWMIAAMAAAAAAAVICWHWLSSTEIYCSEESQVNLSWWGWRGCGDSRSWPLIPHHGGPNVTGDVDTTWQYGSFRSVYIKVEFFYIKLNF